VTHQKPYEPLKIGTLDRAIHNSPPPLDDVGGCDPLDFDEEDMDNPYIEEDPNGFEPADPRAKLDAGKPDLSYLPEQFPLALEAVCRVAEYGTTKYSRGGWLKVPDAVQRYSRALLRHLFIRYKADVIPGIEPRFHADAQIAWNALAVLELKLRGE